MNRKLPQRDFELDYAGHSAYNATESKISRKNPVVIYLGEDEVKVKLNKNHSTHNRYHWLIRWSAPWIGFHYSKKNKRFCINPIPFVTLSITRPQGNMPKP